MHVITFRLTKVVKGRILIRQQAKNKQWLQRKDEKRFAVKVSDTTMLKQVITGEKPAVKTPFKHFQILSKKRSKL
ncbi:hypothetical protein SAE01_16070 [Segetibacter aerophilus]|uniref:Uncharacterized protein n=1 Tax=Segetibacter aerophilus TaxID=670293 RepID=A0A512BAX2_9BACT|nr:hypothetical protein SAE01_16070 [Segetibacter aerophilus]